MTVTGVVLAPVLLLLIMLPWRVVLAALLICSILSDAAIVNIGAFPLSPLVFFGSLMIARFVVELLLRVSTFRRSVLAEVTPLYLAVVLNFALLVIAIVLFQGKVYVVTGTMGFNFELAQPFQLVRENLTQAVYLIFHIALVTVIAHALSKQPDTDAAAIAADRAVVAAIVAATLVVLWEVASFSAGVWFPADFFHSDTHSDAWGQHSLGGTVLRASGPFSEPSGVGFAFGGFLLYSWRRYVEGRGSVALSMALVLGSLASLAFSTSTTGYALLLVFAALVLWDTLRTTGRKAAPGMPRRSRWPGVALLVLGALFAAWALVRNWELVTQIVLGATLEKRGSISFEQRSTVDVMGLQILVDTWGLGLGLGSHKPNNLLVTILSNLGVAGLVLLAWFICARLISTYRITRAFRTAPDAAALAPALRMLLLGLLLAHFVSNPNLNTPSVWITAALIIGISSRLRLDRDAAADILAAAHMDRRNTSRMPTAASGPAPAGWNSGPPPLPSPRPPGWRSGVLPG